MIPEILPAGATLAHYTILEHMASGGMGSVYRAYESALNRQVAIKVLRKEFALKKEYIEIFEEEARTIASLRHPAIVPIYYIGQESGLVFFAMAFIEGEDGLRKLKKIVKFDDQQLKAVAIQATLALREAWQHGIIHRDIKPSNLLFEHGTQNVLLADFGLAQCVRHISESDNFTAGWGSPGYASPEQIMDQPCDLRSDIYSLGATLYHMATGVTAFDSTETISEVYGHLYSEFPAEKALQKCVHPGWVMLIEKMMHKDPAQRHQSYEELLGDLEQVHKVIKYRSFKKNLSVIPLLKRDGWNERTAYCLLKQPATSMIINLPLEKTALPQDLVNWIRAAPSLQKSKDLILGFLEKKVRAFDGEIEELRRELPGYENLVLKLSGTPMFSDRNVEDFNVAVEILGNEKCVKLGLFLLTATLAENDSSPFCFGPLFSHALATGLLSEECARALELNTTRREFECGFISHLAYVLACDISPLAMQGALLRSISEMCPLEVIMHQTLSYSPTDLLTIWLRDIGADKEIIDIFQDSTTSKTQQRIKLTRLALATGNYLASSFAIGYAGGGALPCASLTDLVDFKQLLTEAKLPPQESKNLVEWLEHCASSLSFLAESQIL
jgi:serine/threonine protein kinase